MGYSIPKLTIYAPKSPGDYLIQRYMEHPQFGYSQATGDPIFLSRDELIKEGSRIIRSLLSEYPMQQDIGVSSLDRMSPSDKRRFTKNYLEISVSLPAGGKLIFCLIDTNETGDSGQGRNEDEIKIPSPFTSEQFIGALDAVICQGNMQKL